MKEVAATSLTGKRVAVTGVSRNPGTPAANAVFRRLRDRGYMFAANADEVHGVARTTT